jgi:PAS domain S-box-containing protein
MTSLFEKCGALFSDTLPESAVRKMMLGAATIIIIGFGIAFSSLYLVHSRTEHLSRASRESLQGLAAINHLNFKLKSLSSKKKNAFELREELHRCIETCETVFQRVTASATPLDSDSERRRTHIRNLWQTLAAELRKALIYLENASEIEDQRELVLYGVDLFLDHFDHTQKGAIGNAQLFAEIRDYSKQIAVIEHTVDIFLIQFQQFSDSIDERHGEYLKASQRISVTVFSVVTIFTIVFFTFYSGTLARKLGNMISEIGEQNRQLSERDEELRAIIAAVPDLIFILDSKGCYLDIFAANPKLLFASKETLIGKTIHDSIPQKVANTRQALIDKALETQLIQDCEYELTIDGKQCCFAARLVPFIHKGAPSVICLSRDITDQKQAESKRTEMELKMRQAQKMEAVGQLAGGVAHDFNNMLGVILGHTELSLLHLEKDEPLRSRLEDIQQAALRSADLTRQLLAFARKQTIAPKVLDLNSTIEGMLKLLRRVIGEDIDLLWKPSHETWLVRMDPSQIDQILVNLCVNSRDAIMGCGKVIIETGNVSFDEDYCAHHPGFIVGDYVLLSVSDDGVGMNAETVSHIFEPFFTTKDLGKGTGLGLATVYGIVKQNNCFINVYSEPGQGTTFKIYLPAHAEKITGDVAKVPDLPTEHGHETVLLVEDESAILEMTTKMLRSLGYTVVVAASSTEAIRLAHEHRGRIDLLMTDVVMPEMNGQDLASNLLSHYPDLKRLFMSGYTADIIAHHGVLDEGVFFIQKPFSMKDLGAKLREALEG